VLAHMIFAAILFTTLTVIFVLKFKIWSFDFCCGWDCT